MLMAAVSTQPAPRGRRHLPQVAADDPRRVVRVHQRLRHAGSAARRSTGATPCASPAAGNRSQRPASSRAIARELRLTTTTIRPPSYNRATRGRCACVPALGDAWRAERERDTPGMVIFDDLEAEQDRLENILDGLDEAQWAFASGAAGWTVADVVL